LEIETFHEIGHRIADLTQPSLPCFAVLEGGYSRDFAKCVEEFIAGWSDTEFPPRLLPAKLRSPASPSRDDVAALVEVRIDGAEVDLDVVVRCGSFLIPSGAAIRRGT